MNKAIIPVLILILAIVGISGCTYTTSANKTYSANGVSFVYPGNWSELNKTQYQSEMQNYDEFLFVLGNNQSHLAMGKAVPGSNEELKTLSQWAQETNSTAISGTNPYQYLSEKTLTIAGADAYQLRYKDSIGDYITYIGFVKNNTGYGILYVSAYDDPQTLEDILNSFKMP